MSKETLSFVTPPPKNYKISSAFSYNFKLALTPSSSYTPPINDDGYIVVTMPVTLSGGSTAKQLEAQHQALIAGMSKEEIEQLSWSNVTANKDGSFNYIFTPEQFQRTKEISYMSGKLIDAATNTFPQEFIKAAEYADVDEAGIPWTLVLLLKNNLEKRCRKW